MSHTNRTGPGIESCSTTTLENTDLFLEKIESIDQGALKNKYDINKIAWIGHSRGGEGVVRAYDRLIDENFETEHYNHKNIQFISSIAPTTFLSASKVDPHTVTYHMFVGGADGDVNGSPRSVVMSMPIYERAYGEKQLTYVHGAGHNVFNDESWDEGQGPDRLEREAVHKVSQQYYYSLLEVYLKSNLDHKKYLTQHNSILRPSEIPEHVVISNEYRPDDSQREGHILDDFQTSPELNLSSSGSTVTHNVKNMLEAILQDQDSFFGYDALDGMNGMTRHLDQFEAPKGIIFDWEEDHSFLTYTFSSEKDLTNYTAISFRAAQGSRHPLTIELDQDLNFSIQLKDSNGNNPI